MRAALVFLAVDRLVIALQVELLASRKLSLYAPPWRSPVLANELFLQLTNSNLLNNALSIARCMNLTRKDVLCEDRLLSQDLLLLIT